MWILQAVCSTNTRVTLDSSQVRGAALIKTRLNPIYLDVHFEDSLSDEGGAEEGPEGDEEVAAGDAGKVEERVRDLTKKLIFP
jgi:hypothetical protein